MMTQFKHEFRRIRSFFFNLTITVKTAAVQQHFAVLWWILMNVEGNGSDVILYILRFCCCARQNICITLMANYTAAVLLCITVLLMIMLITRVRTKAVSVSHCFDITKAEQGFYRMWLVLTSRPPSCNFDPPSVTARWCSPGELCWLGNRLAGLHLCLSVHRWALGPWVVWTTPWPTLPCLVTTKHTLAQAYTCAQASYSIHRAHKWATHLFCTHTKQADVVQLVITSS